jgi:hypothetical protein
MIIMIEMDCMALVHDFRDYTKGYDILEAQRTLKRGRGKKMLGLSFKYHISRLTIG